MLRVKRQSALMSKITNDVRLKPVWHRMLYSCTHMATVGVKELMREDGIGLMMITTVYVVMMINTVYSWCFVFIVIQSQLSGVIRVSTPTCHLHCLLLYNLFHTEHLVRLLSCFRQQNDWLTGDLGRQRHLFYKTSDRPMD